MTDTKIGQALETLSAEIEKLQTESGFADYLLWQARFYSYSPANALLIRVQRPDATNVAGYHRWLDLGCYVRKGEKGILVLAPVLRRRDDEDEDRQPITYRAAYIFDIAQTEPLPGQEKRIPQRPDLACPILTGEEGRELHGVLLRVAASEGITVSQEPPPGYEHLTRDDGCMGFYVPKEQRIWVRPNAPLQEVKTLAHELAHHFGCHDASNPNNESIAEAVAYVVLSAFGLDSGARSVPYIVGWDAKRPGAYKSALASIQATAKLIIEKATQTAMMEVAA